MKIDKLMKLSSFFNRISSLYAFDVKLHFDVKHVGGRNAFDVKCVPGRVAFDVNGVVLTSNKGTATEMRKLTSTNVAADGSEDLVWKVAAHMTHGEDTARKYYRHMQGIKESVNAYEATATTSTSGIGQKRPASQVEEKENEISMPKLKKRVKWLQEEEEKLQKYFNIQDKSTPSCEECSTFLTLWRQENDTLFVGRSPKEVLDKFRTIKRQLSKEEH